MLVRADYYDGRQAKRHEVTLSRRADELRIQGSDIERLISLAKVKIPAPLGASPRLILLNDGSRCEVSDQKAFADMFPQSGSNWLNGLENNWLSVLLAIFIIVGATIAGYKWGLPHAAQNIADSVPDAVLKQMDSQFLASFEQTLLKPSGLPPERQNAINEQLHRLTLPPGATRPNLLIFRNSPELGANALALPGGSVLVLDKLVELAANDEEIIAVLAHEIGHVSRRDALRQMLQASVVGLFMTWYIGDISSLVASAPAMLLQTRYSRDLERQADLFAADLLRRNAIPVSRLADMLEKLEASRKADQSEIDENSDRIFDYLSTHPNTGDRVRELRGM